MNLLAKDIPTLVFQILPGFVAASIFYRSRRHPRLKQRASKAHLLAVERSSGGRHRRPPLSPL
jgi:hypothetical protein